jgi:hypothetical protein
MGVRILVNLPVSFPIRWVGQILEESQSRGIDARVYHGIPKLSAGEISNFEYEAREEMYGSEIIFAAITKSDGGKVDGDWILNYTQQLGEREIAVELGLVGIDGGDLVLPSVIHNFGNITLFSSRDDWLNHLLSELNH